MTSLRLSPAAFRLCSLYICSHFLGLLFHCPYITMLLASSSVTELCFGLMVCSAFGKKKMGFIVKHNFWEGTEFLSFQSVLIEENLLWICWCIWGVWPLHECNALLVYISFWIETLPPPFDYLVKDMITFSLPPEDLCVSFLCRVSEPVTDPGDPYMYPSNLKECMKISSFSVLPISSFSA